MKYRIRKGYMLDDICHRHYLGIQPSDAMPKVLAANPGLEQHPPQLPEGLTKYCNAPRCGASTGDSDLG